MTEWVLQRGRFVHAMIADYECVVQQTASGNWNWGLHDETGRLVMTGVEPVGDYAKEIALAVSLHYLKVKAKHAREGALASAFVATLLSELKT